MSTANTAKEVAMTLIERLRVLAAKMDTGPAWADPSIVREAAAALERQQEELDNVMNLEAQTSHAMIRAERAEKALEEAHRDVARLDSIEQNNWFIGKTPSGLWKVIKYQVVSVAEKPKLRAAIDAAMKGDA